MKEPFYITTPIYYVNDSPHLGHAYTSVACDVMARFMRLCGHPVKFLTGTDEHGQKVEKAAHKAGLAPQAFVDDVSKRFQDLKPLLNLSNDDFIRTTEPRHIKAAQAFWQRLVERDEIYLGKYAGWYSVRDEAYYQESELVNGKAPTGADVEWVEEPSYFFRLSKYQDRLIEYCSAPGVIAPDSRKNEVLSFIKGGLKDLSVSRTTFKWGIPVPGDEKHVMYVWVDALVNYLSALGYPDQTEDYKSFWPADLHMVGKDILRFHAVYWPAMLMAAGLEPPKRIFAHGWWTIEGEKMSKSLGNVISPHDLVQEFGLDAVRYFLLREVPFGNDGNFSRERLVSVVNSELANNIGNLVQRTLSMIQRNCEGKVPDNQSLDRPDNSLLAEIQEFLRLTGKDSDNPGYIKAIMGLQSFNIVFDCLIGGANRANEYIDKQAPWNLKKENNISRLNAVLYTLAEAIRWIAVVLQPFTPDAASKILDQLAVPQDQRTFNHLTPEFALKPGTPLPPPVPVFPRIETKK